MKIASVLLSLAALVAAAPAPISPSFASLQSEFAASPGCTLPTPKPTCFGVQREDIIVLFDADCTAQSQMTLLNAVKASGAEVVYDWKKFGFAGFVPVGVADLLRATEQFMSFKVFPNGCVTVPEPVE